MLEDSKKSKDLAIIYLSEPLVKNSYKRVTSTEKPQYRVLQVR